jgi:hypothetical protein
MLDPANLIEIGQIATSWSLSSLRTGTLRLCAIVFEMNRKTGENDGEKDYQITQPDPLGGNIADDQAIQTRKRNAL